jgi:transposase-like protein
MNDNNRRFFRPEQKVAFLREHLVEGKAVSDLCEKHRIHPDGVLPVAETNLVCNSS